MRRKTKPKTEKGSSVCVRASRVKEDANQEPRFWNVYFELF